MPADANARATEALTEPLEAAASLEQLGLEGVEPAYARPIWC